MLLKLENISKVYENGSSVKNISFEVNEGESVALIGESGSGKTTIAKIIMGLTDKSSGNIYYKERDRIQYIFQNPYTSLNPKMNIKDIILEGIRYKKEYREIDDIDEFLENILEEVGLEKTILTKYPHELSGGQNQRIGIARALVMKPTLLIADECFSSLDMLTQKQIVELFEKIKRERNLAFLLITHDISLVKKVADRIVNIDI